MTDALEHPFAQKGDAVALNGRPASRPGTAHRHQKGNYLLPNCSDDDDGPSPLRAMKRHSSDFLIAVHRAWVRYETGAEQLR